MLTDEGDDLSVWDFTIKELQTLVPKEARRKLDIISNVKEAASAGARESVSRTVPKVVGAAYQKLACAEPGDNPFVHQKRHSGGGRKKTHDIGNIQVKAVLALIKRHRENKIPLNSVLAYSAVIIRNPPKGIVKPYETARVLESAVRQYCNREGILYNPLVGK